MGQGKKVIGVFLSVILTLFVTSCGEMFDPTSNFLSDDNDDTSSSEAEAAIEATSAYAVAIGGIAKGRDELVIYDSDNKVRDFSGHTLTFQTNNENIELRTREGFTDFMTGSGALIVPKNVGITIISYSIDGVEQTDKYKVIVPPQSLIQILLGEARGQIESEAQVKDGNVELTSDSPTGNAIASVIRNRVQLLEAGQQLSLFVVDDAAWNLSPVGSHWDSVITAGKNGVYQFSPLDPDTLSHEVYLSSAKRNNLLDESEITAYDQAVLTAAEIFTNETTDPTSGAFAFRSPNVAQTNCLDDTLTKKLTELPPECGPGDDNYPAFAPIQILIHPSVAKLNDGRPSFVFMRNRSEDEPVVTNAP